MLGTRPAMSALRRIGLPAVPPAGLIVSHIALLSAVQPGVPLPLMITSTVSAGGFAPPATAVSGTALRDTAICVGGGVTFSVIEMFPAAKLASVGVIDTLAVCSPA